MEERPPATAKPPPPTLQKPPGYRDPAAPAPALRPPPRKQTLPTSFRPGGANTPKHYRRRRRRHCCRRLCCWFCLILLVLFFALALAGALCYLWFQPKLPSFHLESIQTPQFAVRVKPDGSFLDARTVVRLQVANPNGKIGLSYAPCEARVTVPGDDDSGDVALGSGSSPGFDQGRKNSTVMRFEARVKGVMVDDRVGATLGAQHRSKSLRVAVEVRTRVGVVAGGKRSGRVPVKVVCRDVRLKQLQAGGGSAPKCTINLLKCKYVIVTSLLPQRRAHALHAHRSPPDVRRAGLTTGPKPNWTLPVRRERIRQSASGRGGGDPGARPRAQASSGKPGRLGTGGHVLWQRRLT